MSQRRGYSVVAQEERGDEHCSAKYNGLRVQTSPVALMPKFPSNSVASNDEIIQAAGGQKAVDAYKKKLQKHQDKVAAENQRKLEEYRRAQQKHPSSKYMVSEETSEKPLW